MPPCGSISAGRRTWFLWHCQLRLTPQPYFLVGSPRYSFFFCVRSRLSPSQFFSFIPGPCVYVSIPSPSTAHTNILNPLYHHHQASCYYLSLRQKSAQFLHPTATYLWHFRGGGVWLCSGLLSSCAIIIYILWKWALILDSILICRLVLVAHAATSCFLHSSLRSTWIFTCFVQVYSRDFIVITLLYLCLLLQSNLQVILQASLVQFQLQAHPPFLNCLLAIPHLSSSSSSSPAQLFQNQHQQPPLSPSSHGFFPFLEPPPSQLGLPGN